MSQNNGTGIEYPTIELGGKTYTVKFSRGLLYRLAKAGVKIETRQIAGGVSMPFEILVDAYHVLIGFEGSHEELAEMMFDKRGEALNKLLVAVGKTLPAAPIKLEEPAAKRTSDPALM